MNPGMYPIILDAQGQGLRRPAGQVRNGYSQVTSAGNAVNSVGLPFSTNTALAAGVRTRLLSVTGRGAARFGLIHNGTGADGTSFLAELWIDGVRVVANTAASGTLSASNATCYVGGASSSGASTLDWIPFETSLDVYVTSGSAGSYIHAYLIDIHQ